MEEIELFKPYTDRWKWTVGDLEDGIRLDLFLNDKEFGPQNPLGLTRSRIKRLIESGSVTVDEIRVRPAKKLRTGQVVRLEMPPPEPSKLLPEPIPLDIHYEDEVVVVINKPQGLVVHPAPGHSGGTLVNGLLYAHNPEGGDPLRPGIVHRLDKDTSGLMVVAKREDAHAALAAQFHEHSVDRRYRVLVVGHPPDAGVWQTLHGRSSTDRRRFTTKVSRGRTALSRFVVEHRFKHASELRVTLQTGRTHQVRVHCSDHGFPVLGDRLYIPRHLSREMREIHCDLPGQALHAELLGFEHPVSGVRLQFTAPPPPAYCQALDRLKALV